MIINDYYQAKDALKEATGTEGCLILDVDPSLDADEIVYAYRKCDCGAEGYYKLGMLVIKKCLCGNRDLSGFTADMVVMEGIVLWNYDREW